MYTHTYIHTYTHTQVQASSVVAEGGRSLARPSPPGRKADRGPAGQNLYFYVCGMFAVMVAIV